MKQILLSLTLLLISLSFCLAQRATMQQSGQGSIGNGEVPMTQKYFAKKTPAFEKAQIRIFPNPATLYFEITTSERIGQVVLYNIIGRKVKKFLGSEGPKYDIDDLPMGMYLLQILDEEGVILATRRLSKRNP